MCVYSPSWPHLCVVVQLRPLLRLILHVPVEAVVVARLRRLRRLRRLGRGSERLHGAVARAVPRLLQQQVGHAAGELPTAGTGEHGDMCLVYSDKETDDANVELQIFISQQILTQIFRFLTSDCKKSRIFKCQECAPSPAQPMTICSPVPGNSLVTLRSLGVIGTLEHNNCIVRGSTGQHVVCGSA